MIAQETNPDYQSLLRSYGKLEADFHLVQQELARCQAVMVEKDKALAVYAGRGEMIAMRALALTPDNSAQFVKITEATRIAQVAVETVELMRSEGYVPTERVLKQVSSMYMELEPYRTTGALASLEHGGEKE